MSSKHRIITRRVLVVDEDADSAEVIGQQLEARGHTSRAVSSTAKAMRAAMDLAPEVAVIGLSLGDPLSYALARQLRMLPGLEKLRVIAATDSAIADIIAESGPAGVQFFRCLSKPVEPSTLFAAIEDES